MKGIVIILAFAILISNVSAAQASECDYKIELIIDGDEFEKADFKWKMRALKVEGTSTNITGTARIEDSNGKTIKNYKPWTSASISKQKTSSEYSPNLAEGEEYEIKAEISVECDDTNKGNNVATKEIKIKGEKKAKVKEEDDKGSNADDAGKIEEKKSNKKAAQPEVRKTISEKAVLKAEPENIIYLKPEKTQKAAVHQVIKTPVLKNPQAAYESSNEKVKRWIMIFLLALSILLNAIFIWKR